MSKKENLVGVAGSLSGITSLFGSWQVCHNLCLGLIAVLSFIGITIAGMPLMFLQKLALPFWIAALSLLLVTLLIYFKKRCISQKLILFNSGLIIIGTPFQSLQKLSPLFWIVGGALVLLSFAMLIKERFSKLKCRS